MKSTNDRAADERGDGVVLEPGDRVFCKGVGYLPDGVYEIIRPVAPLAPPTGEQLERTKELLMDELTRGPRIADARDLAKSTGAPYAIVLVGDGAGTVLLASWGEDARACRGAARLVRELSRTIVDSSGVECVVNTTAELPTDDGEAGGDD